MKKNNGQRKAIGRRKKGRQKTPAAPVKTSARAPAVKAKPSDQHPFAAPQTAPRRSSTISTLGRVDWTALAIVVAPLALMALLQSYWIEPSSRLAEHTAPPYIDLVRGAEPVERAALAPISTPEPAPISSEVQPSPATPVEAASLVPPQSEPAVEAAPAAPPMPEPAAPADIASLAPEPAPPLEPWHGDLAHSLPAITEPENAHDGLPPSLPVVATLAPSMCVSNEPAQIATSLPRPDSFGEALGAGARAQIDSFVIYNARYMRIAYPGGDTQPLYGVCTDVVIRAYRALGIDLQALIHTSRLGRGDPSIDHRRVEIVRRFLERHGTSLPISEFAEDYRPGDIVTYHRPGGRTSQDHIAIVSDRMAPSGRPLIAHNRGWGPQLEDALFVDRITGHYRLSPEQVEAFERTRAPHLSESRRRRTADVAGTTRR